MTRLGKVQSWGASFESPEPRLKLNAASLCNPRWKALTNESPEAKLTVPSPSGLATLVYAGKTAERPCLKEGRK